MLALPLGMNLAVCSSCCSLLNDVKEVAVGLIFLSERIDSDENRARSACIGILKT